MPPLHLSGTSGVIMWDLWRMEHAATLYDTIMPVADKTMWQQVEDDVNAEDHYCYKIRLRNTDPNHAIGNIYIDVGWDKTSPSPVLTMADAQLINYVEPFPHAARRWVAATPEKANCLTILFRSLNRSPGPGNEAVSAISFRIQSMTGQGTFRIFLSRIVYTPYAIIPNVLQPLPEETHDFLVTPITEPTID
jgi:hypothetical protein